MTLEKQDFQYIREKMETAAKETAIFIKYFNKNNLQISRKKTGATEASQIVTQADFHSQKIILEIIQELIDKYQFDIIAEESCLDSISLSKDYLMLIDPLDGTLPFIENIPGYAVSLALINKENIPLIGVIADVASGDIYSAVKGAGVLKNGFLVSGSVPQDNGEIRFFLDRSSENNPLYNQCISYITHKKSVKNPLIVIKNTNYGAVMNACSAINSSPSVYFKLPRKESGGGAVWDFAATACIYNEMGYWVSDVFGNPLKLYPSDNLLYMNKSGVIYSNDEDTARNIISFYSTNLLKQGE